MRRKLPRRRLRVGGAHDRRDDGQAVRTRRQDCGRIAGMDAADGHQGQRHAARRARKPSKPQAGPASGLVGVAKTGLTPR